MKKPETEIKAFIETEKKWDTEEEFIDTGYSSCALCVFHGVSFLCGDCDPCVLENCGVKRDEAALFLDMLPMSGDKWNTAVMRLVLQKVRPEMERREVKRLEREAKAAKAKEPERIVWEKRKGYTCDCAYMHILVRIGYDKYQWVVPYTNTYFSYVGDAQETIDYAVKVGYPVTVYDTHTAALQYIIDQEAGKQPKPWTEYSAKTDKCPVYNHDKYYVFITGDGSSNCGGPYLLSSRSSGFSWVMPGHLAFWEHDVDSGQKALKNVMIWDKDVRLFECNKVLDAIECMRRIVMERERAGK